MPSRSLLEYRLRLLESRLVFNVGMWTLKIKYNLDKLNVIVFEFFQSI